MINDDSLLRIKQLAADGFAINRIAELLNLPFFSVKSAVLDNRFAIEKRTFSESEEEIQRIIRLFKEGVSIKTFGKIYNIDKRRIEKLLAANNVSKKPENDVRQIIKMNDNIFDNIDTPAKAYWLGFLYADGAVKPEDVALYLSVKDDDHVIKFANFMGISHNRIKYYLTRDITNKKSGKTYECAPTCSISVKRPRISQKLQEHGCFLNKSLILEYPTWMPQELEHHFIRGYFDGDGSINFTSMNLEWKLSIAGTLSMLEGISRHFENKLGSKYKFNGPYKIKDENIHILEKSGNRLLKEICDELWRDSTDDIRLSRKYEIYNIFLKDRSEIDAGLTRSLRLNIEHYNETSNRSKKVEAIKKDLEEKRQTTPNFSLNENDLNSIKEKYLNGEGVDDIAKAFKSTPHIIDQQVKTMGVWQSRKKEVPESIINEMYELFKTGLNSVEIGKKFAYDPTTVQKVLKRKFNVSFPSNKQYSSDQLTSEQWDELFARNKAGESIRQLAKEFNISDKVIYTQRNKRNLSPPVRHITLSIAQQMKDDKLAGMTYKDLVAKYQFSDNAIIAAFKKYFPGELVK